MDARFIRLLDFVSREYFGAKTSVSEDHIDRRKDELMREDPELVKDWDHKDWRHNDTIICYWRGYEDAITEVWEDLGRLIEHIEGPSEPERN